MYLDNKQNSPHTHIDKYQDQLNLLCNFVKQPHDKRFCSIKIKYYSFSGLRWGIGYILQSQGMHAV